MGAPRKVKIAAALAAGAIAISATAALAGWRDEASDYDINRLTQLEQWREKAVWEAQHYSDHTGNFAAIRETLEPQGHAVPARALVGHWKCRNMKMGGMNAYIVYGWFDCSISAGRDGLIFRKNDGTLRTQGILYPENGAWIYLGAQSARGEPWHRYSGRTPSAGAVATPDDQIGLLSGIGNNRLRLEIPGPVEESTYDVIELAR
ncbi:MAG: DUF4893 domain-containing protein [Alphaproteobacteria bacterium]|nr:DUF4893 domain-containing protein [Alphaproteobacteria bacterium]